MPAAPATATPKPSATIPITPALRQGGDEGVPILVQYPNSPVSKSFLDIAAKLAGQLSIASERAKKGGPAIITT